jgi:methyl-accepting chemotaxis protein
MSISKKIGLIIVASLFVTLSIMMVVLFTNETSSQNSEAIKEVETLSQVLIKSITFTMAQGITDVSGAIEKINGTPNIASLSIRKSDKIDKDAVAKMDQLELETLKQKKTITLQEIYKDKPVCRIVQPIISDETCNGCHGTQNGEVLAVVSLRYSLEETEANVASMKRNALILAVFTIIITLLICYVLVNKTVGRPIKQISETSEKIAQGNFDIKFDEYNSNDELGSMSCSLKNMTAKVLDKSFWYEQLLDSIPFPVSVTDLNMRWTFINKAAEEITGRKRKDIIGQECKNWGANICNTEKCGVNCLNRGEKTTTFVQPVIEKEYQVDTSFILNKEGKKVGHIEVVQDVSKMKEMQNYLSDSASKMLVVMEKFAAGDLTISLPVDKDDEIGKLYKGFNLSVSKVKNLLSEVNQAVTATASASHQITSSAEEMSAGAQEQSSQTSEVAGAVEQITKTIIESTEDAASAMEAAAKAGKIAKKGGSVVEETIKGMNNVSLVVKRSAETVQALGKSSDQIGEIIQVINDIADQTNLLALNAAIEAARAGEQGRGFAVVADEVRKLAERTTKATKEIAQMIHQIQKDTSEAVLSMQAGTIEVEKGKRLADEAGASLSEIISGAENVVRLVQKVAEASHEESSRAEEISKNIEAINNVTKESADGIHQIAKASEDLNRLTVNLQQLVSKFKINSDSNYKYAIQDNGKLVSH